MEASGYRSYMIMPKLVKGGSWAESLGGVLATGRSVSCTGGGRALAEERSRRQTIGSRQDEELAVGFCWWEQACPSA